jgi:hypothetical protein
MFLTPRGERGVRLIYFAVYEMADAAGAAALFDLSVKVARARDERLKEGNMRIVRAEYGEVACAGADRTTRYVKTMMVSGREVAGQAAMAQARRFVLSVSFSDEPVTVEELGRLLELMCGFVGK